MKDKIFRPMKAPNEQLPGNSAYDKVCNLCYPLYGSYKYDGFRTLYREGQMFTSALKTFRNIHVNKKFKPIVDYIQNYEIYNYSFDGELLSPTVPFNNFSGIFRSDEQELPNDVKFYLFDVVCNDNFDEPFKERINNIGTVAKLFPELIVPVEQRLLNTPEEVVGYYEEALSQTFEYNNETYYVCDGLMLRSPESYYKRGRGTLKEQLIFKLKPYQDFDATIIDIVEGTNVDPNAEKTTTELGYSKTSKKKNDRINGGWACDFIVMHESDKELKVSISETMETKIDIWNNKEKYIGKTVEYKGLMVNIKDLPRHPTSYRMRPDKD
jgi:DNA ligase 1